MDDLTPLGQLVLRERQARDRGWWSVMRDCLAPDAAIRLSWFRGTGERFIAESERLAARGEVSSHTMGPPVIARHGDRAVIEASTAIHLRTDLNGTEADLVSHARLIYRAEHRSERWTLISLDPVYEYDTLTASVPGTRIELDPDLVAGARPAYRMLTCVLRARGYPVADDLYGADRPEPVRAFYRELADWRLGATG